MKDTVGKGLNKASGFLRYHGQNITKFYGGNDRLAVDIGAAATFIPDALALWLAPEAGAAKIAQGAGAMARVGRGSSAIADVASVANKGTRLMDRGASVASNVGESAQKIASVASAETNAGKKIVQKAAKPVALAATEKSLARDIDLRVKPKSDSILSASDPAQAFEAKFGKKAIQNMSDHELAQTLANRADKTALGEFGAAVGKQKHKRAEQVFNRYQKMTGQRLDLVAEKRYKDGVAWDTGMGLQGSVKPDLYNKTTGIPYDYKFGDAVGNKNQIDRYKKALPKMSDGSDATMEIIKPNH